MGLGSEVLDSGFKGSALGEVGCELVDDLAGEKRAGFQGVGVVGEKEGSQGSGDRFRCRRGRGGGDLVRVEELGNEELGVVR